jgi:hypothetical protein
MANAVFSPRDFKAWVKEEATTGTPDGYTGMYQLDVDSVAFPSLSPNQVTAVRSRAGRVLNINDFFQDNEIRAVEVSLSGTFRRDVGTTILMQSVTGSAIGTSLADITLSSTATGISGKYGESEGDKTFTLVLAPPDTTDGYNTVLTGCLCTSFSINADMTADGGLYKFEATISTGQNPITNNSDAEAGTVFGSDLITLMTSTSASNYVGGIGAPVISSFGVTIESPAVYTGFSSSGYHSFARGAEFTVSANATVKYDSVTRPLYHNFNNQTSAVNANFFSIIQPDVSSNKMASITIAEGFLTDVTFNEGDAMMLDVAMQGVGDDHDVILIDQA